jgi:ribulose-5-phosphate 4-epimerase/fuculose-1-phosphate aldolase
VTHGGAAGTPLQRARLCDEIVATARAMNALGINRGRAGNVSARCGDGFLVTPSALPYDRMQPSDIVYVSSDGIAAPGPHPPSTEWRFHRDILRTRADVHAIVHTHAPFATTLACLDRGIPAFHYMVARAGGHDIRCAPYATFGTQELSDHALAALHERRACLLAHHGAIALGESLDAALGLAVEVETLAEMYWRAIQVAEPRVLDPEEMRRVLERYRDYGARARSVTD